MSEQHAEYLRSPEAMCDADVRNEGRLNVDEAGTFPFTVEDHHRRVAELVLNPAVPKDIVIQFETSKNLYLYAWCVYRFYPVARLHVLTVLELALRERFGEEIPANDKTYRRGKEKRLYLSSMLHYCKDKGLLRAEMFEQARHMARVRARSRHMFETIQVMSDLGLDEMEYDDSEIELKDDDWEFDHVGRLVKSLPESRNTLAHGSRNVSNIALGTLRTVSEIINQLWK